MKKKVKKIWLKALRSGKYKQCQGTLKSIEGDKFCCLGVLCDLYSKENNIRWDDRNNFLGYSGTLPSEVMFWAGISKDLTSTVLINNYIKYFDLAQANDRGVSFKEIATTIEKQL